MTALEQEIAHLQELQAKHRKNIRTLEEMLANYGMDRPLPLLNNLDFEHQQLRQVEEELAAALAAQAGTGGAPTAPVEPGAALPTGRVTVTGSGAAAGEKGTAAGAGGVAVSGDVHGGVHVQIGTLPPTPEEHILPYHNLPSPDYGQFIGREEELAKIHGLLLPYPRSRYHVITIDGIGGIGKSTLALEAAYRYLREYDSLPANERFDAIIWTSAKQSILTAEGIISRRAELHNLNDIYTTISATLEREDITQARAEERPAVVARALARQRTLLIIDNLETVEDEQVMAFIREVPDPTKIIVTTRQRIDIAYPVRLVEMPWDDAQSLIAQECEKKHVMLTDEQARQLYDRTGGVPLALVWSIARVALGEDVKYVLRRLARPDSDLARFCFEGVVQHLRDNESYQLLVASALFAQDMSREALGHVAGIEDELSCEDGLITLERLSLLNRQADRFSLLPLTRSYLDQELEQRPEFAQAASERLLAYYKELVTPPKDVLVGVPYWDGMLNYAGARSLRPEWGNLAHVIRWALDGHRYAVALDLFLPIVHFLNLWGLWDERLRLSHEMCRAANMLGDPSEAWLWIDAIGWIRFYRQQFSEYADALQMGKLLARRFDLVDALILADAFEARLYSAMGETVLALQRIESALEQVDLDSVLEHRSKVRQIVAVRVASTAARLSQSKQDFAPARELFELELELRRSIGEATAPTLWRLGHISLKLGDIAAAEKYLVQALEGAGPKDVAWIHYGLALVAEQRGDLQETQHWCKLALQRFTQLGLASGMHESEQLLARLQR